MGELFESTRERYTRLLRTLKNLKNLKMSGIPIFVRKNLKNLKMSGKWHALTSQKIYFYIMVLSVSLFCLNMCQKCDLRALENSQNSKFKMFSQFSSGSFTAFHRPIYVVYQVDILLILLPKSQVILEKLQDGAKKCQENEQNMSGKIWKCQEFQLVRTPEHPVYTMWWIQWRNLCIVL